MKNIFTGHRKNFGSGKCLPHLLPPLFMLLLSVLFISSCSTGIPPEKQCAIDKDCVPAGCCHADDAVNKNFGPDCAETLCTMECAAGTLDCGQGEIKCLEGRCTAVIGA